MMNNKVDMMKKVGYTEEQIERRFNTTEDWLKETDAEKQLVPIKAMLYKFVRKQKTRYATDIIKVTENGFTVPTDNYNDYVNACYIELLELSRKAETWKKINNIECSILFSYILFVAVNRGIEKCYKEMHYGSHGDKVVDTDISDYWTSYNAGTGKSSEPSYTVENKVVRKVYMDGIMEYAKSKPNIERYVKLYMSGYTFEQIGDITCVKKTAVKMALKRFGNDCKAKGIAE